MKSDISPSRRHLHVPSFERQTDRTRRTTDSALHALTSTDTDTHLVALRPPPSALRPHSLSPRRLSSHPPLRSRLHPRRLARQRHTPARISLSPSPARPPACLPVCLPGPTAISKQLAGLFETFQLAQAAGVPDHTTSHRSSAQLWMYVYPLDHSLHHHHHHHHRLLLLPLLIHLCLLLDCLALHNADVTRYNSSEVTCCWMARTTTRSN